MAQGVYVAASSSVGDLALAGLHLNASQDAFVKSISLAVMNEQLLICVRVALHPEKD